MQMDLQNILWKVRKNLCAVAAVEFALFLAAMGLVFTTCLELLLLTAAQRQVTAAATTTATIISQADADISSRYLDGLIEVSSQSLMSAQLVDCTVSISAISEFVSRNEDGQEVTLQVDWEHSRQITSESLAHVETGPIAINASDSELLNRANASQYQPLTGSLFFVAVSCKYNSLIEFPFDIDTLKDSYTVPSREGVRVLRASPE